VSRDDRLPLLLGDESAENLAKARSLGRVQKCLRLIDQKDGVRSDVRRDYGRDETPNTVAELF
jgi:hypothetical protein